MYSHKYSPFKDHKHCSVFAFGFEETKRPNFRMAIPEDKDPVCYSYIDSDYQLIPQKFYSQLKKEYSQKIKMTYLRCFGV